LKAAAAAVANEYTAPILTAVRRAAFH
jgi:hypothetical protein